MSEHNNNKKPFTSSKKKESKAAKSRMRPGFCPKCGAYVGAFYSCKWCGAKMPHGNRLRISQVLSVIGMIIGIIVLGIYAQAEPAPLVNIGEIGPTYSNAAVRIEGEITAMDYYEAEDDSWKILVLTINDGTGSIDVKAYTEVIDEIIRSENPNRKPAVGDNCSIRGSVYIKGEDLHLMLESKLFLHTNREVEFPKDGQPIQATDFSAIYKDHINERVYINGTVGEIGDSFFMINTTAGENIRVYVPNYVELFNPDISIINKVLQNSYIEVKGICREYGEGMPQIIPSSENDVGGDL